MQFYTSTFALAALSIGSAFAQTDGPAGQIPVHVVSVSNMAGDLVFAPNKLTAKVGEMVQFQFAPKNHSVVQSTFDNPCSPVSDHSNATGIFSGYMPVSANATSVPTYTILVNDTKPLWLYCSQATHCQKGMVMVINENTKANASRSFEAYAQLAASVGSTSAPSTGVSNGTDSTIPAASAGSGSSGSSGSSSTPTSGSSSSGSSTSNTTSSSSATVTPNSAGMAMVSQTVSLGALVAVGVAFFL